MDWQLIIGWVGSLGIVTTLGAVVVQRLKSKGDVQIAEIDRSAALEQSNSELALKLVSFADENVHKHQEELRKVDGEMRLLREHLAQTVKAIGLLRDILYAEAPEQRERSENVARLFLMEVEQADIPL